MHVINELTTMQTNGHQNRMPATNSTYPKGGVSCSKDSFVVNQTLVFQIKFCGKNPALRVAAKRCRKPLSYTKRRKKSHRIKRKKALKTVMPFLN